eukprot:5311324-Pleurochrysis_carterae.AAC.1
MRLQTGYVVPGGGGMNGSGTRGGWGSADAMAGTDLRIACDGWLVMSALELHLLCTQTFARGATKRRMQFSNSN